MAHAARLSEARRRQQDEERLRRHRRALHTVHPPRRYERLDDEAVAAIAQTLGMTVEATRDLLFDLLPDPPAQQKRRP